MMPITVQHDPYDPNEHSQPSYRCYPTPPGEGGIMGWMLVGSWTEDEIAQVNAALLRYPLPRDEYSTQYWYLTKSHTFERDSYSIVQTIRGNASYETPLRHDELTELLRIWDVIEQNTHGPAK